MSASQAHPLQPTNLSSLSISLTKTWHPVHLLTLNSTSSFKIAKISGSFIWHSHPNTDEVFLVVSGGPLLLELDREPRRFSPRSGIDGPENPGEGYDRVELGLGDCFVVPRGMKHRPVALEGETGILMVEEVGTVNTGDATDTEAGRGLTVKVNEA
jgi:mannose-6-phosphate isomerase-like protein (cupin superfamily)